MPTCDNCGTARTYIDMFSAALCNECVHRTCIICREQMHLMQVDAAGVCATCRNRRWTAPLAEPNRPIAPCSRCRSTSFLHIPPEVDYNRYVDHQGHLKRAPLHHWWATRDGDVVSVYPPGCVHTYICRGCGLLEKHINRASEIDDPNAEVIELATHPPYR